MSATTPELENDEPSDLVVKAMLHLMRWRKSELYSSDQQLLKVYPPSVLGEAIFRLDAASDPNRKGA